MKSKFIALAVILMVTAVPFTITAHAEEVPPEEAVQEAPAEQTASRPEDLYTYSINSAGMAEITDFKLAGTYTGELVIPDQLEGCAVGYIGNAAFMNAQGITSITIPASVTDMGNSVFFGCTSLERFHVQEGNPYFSATDDGVLLADSNQFLAAYPAAKPGDGYIIPGSIDEIAPGCFGFAQNLKEITLPGSVKYIDSWAFAYSNLEKINTGTAMQIDEYAFAYCGRLHEVTFNSGLESIYAAAFASCTALEQITLPDTLTYIGQFAFSGTGIKSVTIPAAVTELDYGAFGYTADLKPMGSFVIYGETGTQAEAYCTASDAANDYQNNFTFIAVNNADEPQEIQTEAPPEETQISEETASQDTQSVSASAASADREETAAVIEENTGEPGLTDVLAPEVKGSQFLQILLATAGGIAVILAVTLLVLLAKKPKKKQEDDES